MNTNTFLADVLTQVPQDVPSKKAAFELLKAAIEHDHLDASTAASLYRFFMPKTKKLVQILIG